MNDPIPTLELVIVMQNLVISGDDNDTKFKNPYRWMDMVETLARESIEQLKPLLEDFRVREAAP